MYVQNKLWIDTLLLEAGHQPRWIWILTKIKTKQVMQQYAFRECRGSWHPNGSLKFFGVGM